MELILDQSEAGKKRKERVDNRITTYIVDKVERSAKERRTEGEEGEPHQSR